MIESWKLWYDALSKPSWTPDGSVIGIIWTTLYPIIIGSFLFVVWKTWKKELHPSGLVVFSINLIANLLFSPIQFGLQNLWLATIDIFIVLGTIVAEIIMSWKKYKWLAIAQIPYLAWVSTATVLQVSILIMNM